MKFLINIKYQVTTADYTTKHAVTKSCDAADAAMCLTSAVRQLAAETPGIITNILASVAIDHSPVCAVCGEPVQSDCNVCDICLEDANV